MSTDFSHKIKSFTHLVLLNSYFRVGCNRVKILFNLKWNMLGEFGHSFDSASFETKVLVVNDRQKLTVAFLKQKLALLLKHRDINVAFSQVVVA